MTTRPAPTPSTPDASNSLMQRYGRIAGIVLLIAVLFSVLMVVDNSSLLAPLWTAIAFPALAISPFIILLLKIPQKVKIFLILILLLLLMPILGLKDSYYFTLVTQIGIFAAMALGLNIVVGFAGLLDLGYVAFFAVGAYLWGIFTSQTDTFIHVGNMTAPAWMFYVFLFLAIGVAALAGILLGLPVLRLRGDYLAIVTLGFGEMVRILFSNLDHPVNITNGSLGLDNLASPPLPQFIIDFVNTIVTVFHLKVENPAALAFQFFFYFLVLIICGFVILAVSRLENSPIGRAWTAIREDETAALAMGVPLVRMKLLAFAAGASFAGAMGVVYAAKFKSLTPDGFDFNQSIFILAMVVVGGMGSIRGVLLGATVVSLLNLQILQSFSDLINGLKNQNVVIPIINFAFKDWPNQLEPAKYQRFVFGILLILIVLFRPAGLLPASRRKLELEERMGKSPPPAPSDLAEFPVDPTLTEDMPHATGS
jgi:branched-chain amino acid transport system permease protein